MFPVAADDVAKRVRVGGAQCAAPYDASLLNISAMSYGALSGSAVAALNRGAALGGFAHNTGEGGISRFHREGGGDIFWNIGTGYFACGDSNGPNGARRFNVEQFRENARSEQARDGGGRSRARARFPSEVLRHPENTSLLLLPAPPSLSRR